MTRNLKALGLALAAVFALGAMAVSSASADTFAGNNAPTYLTGTQGAVFDEFEVTAGNTSCEEIKYTGEMAKSPATSFKLTPTYNKCKCLGQVCTVDMKTCSYNFTINDTIANDTTGTIHFECTTKGDEITLTVGSPTVTCIIHIEEQTVPVTYSSVGGGTQVKAEVNYNLVRYSETKGSGLPACSNSNPVTQTGGKYKGEGVISGFSDKAHTKAGAITLIK